MRPNPGRARPRSIRTLLALIFIVPLASLLALWGFAASVTVANAVQEHNFSIENRLYGGSAQVLGADLAQERMQVFDWLAAGRRSSARPMLAQFTKTDAAISSFRAGVSTRPGMIQAASRPALQAFEADLSRLPALRTEIQTGHITPLAAFEAYNSIADAQFQLYSELVVVSNTSLYMQAAASVEAGRGLELADREITLLSGALATGGTMSTAERTLFAQEVASRRLLMTDALRELSPALGSGYVAADHSAAYSSFEAIENEIVASIGTPGPITLSPLQFGAATLPLFTQYQRAEGQDRVALTREGTQVGDRSLLELGLAGGAGLVAVALSVFLMLRFGRRISRDLTGLQGAALDLAQNRLPRVVTRLSRGEEVDVAAEAAPLMAGRIAETAQVADAFSSVQRTAVETAVGQARLRSGVSQVFQNLAWRSQSLLHRQLALLDAMERKTTEPATLDELYQLDHLTTRMRRHAEGLIILSGSVPGRGWREPVPLVDVLRGAVAEVEDYKRVTVICESRDAVAGTVVADVIHLLAELIENATAYSPGPTGVMVRAERVANGFAVEIEDRGIGIGPAEMAAVNERLASPPEFDIADGNQLGLFVVARLAARHRVRVTLRSSPYGGTTAIVLLPHAILAVSELAEPESFDVFRRQLPVVDPRDGGTGRSPAGMLAVGRLAPYLAADQEEEEGSHWPAVGPGWDTVPALGPAPVQGSAPAQESAPAPAPAAEPGVGVLRPRLPRRVRQANLAPQLRDRPDGAADTGAGDAGPQASDTDGDGQPGGRDGQPGAPDGQAGIRDGQPGAPDGQSNGRDWDGQPGSADVLSPAGTRALMRSVQAALERARTAAPPSDDAWPPEVASPDWTGLAGPPEDPEVP
jgi:signal transduction histidine kinase